MNCALCTSRACASGSIDRAPDDCPMRWQDDPGRVLRERVKDHAIHNLFISAARTEAVGYCRWTRLEETMEFAKFCGFERLGIAFCSGLREEARILDEVLKANGFEVYSAICSCGSVPKEEIGISDAEKVRPGTRETVCNPIGQAHILAKMKTDLNVVVGLCVGHDSLFLMHSKSPATVLVAKDRVLAHNPVGAIYLAKGYYRKKLNDHPLDRVAGT